MSAAPDSTPGKLTDLPCSTLVYRALVRSDHFKKGVVLSGAFIRRARDVDGLSVNLVEHVSLEELRGRFTKGCHGVLTLHVGRIRDVGLDVEHSPEPEAWDHALIVGLPDPEIDPALAERLASQLREQARLCWPS